MDNRAIGVFDSGIGGLTVVKELIKILPNEDIIYFGDTARVPYGNRSEETIKKFAMECAKFLENKNIKTLIIACNTVSAVALDLIDENLSINTIGVILPGSKMANKISENGKIGVIATNATISNGAYEKCIKNENEKNIVFSKACPLFVPIAEEGLAESQIAIETAKHYLKDIVEKEVDTVVMGCTHYPILEYTIKKVVGNSVKLVNPAKETAEETKNYLIENDLLRDGQPSYTFYVTDDEVKFEKNLLEIIEIKNPKIKKINLKTSPINE